MNTPEGRTLALFIAVVLPLAYLTYWVLHTSSLLLAANILLAAGAIVAIALGTIVLRRGTAAKRPTTSVIIGIILCGLIFLGLNVGPGGMNTAPALSATRSR